MKYWLYLKSLSANFTTICICKDKGYSILIGELDYSLQWRIDFPVITYLL